MEYKIDFGRWNCVFAVPCDIVDKYITKLTGEQLKVLLYLMRNSGRNVTQEDISSFLEISPDVSLKCLNSLCEMGLISKRTAENENMKVKKSEFCSAKKSPEIKYKRPSAIDIARRVETSEEIYFMMQEAQVVLGRILTSSDSAVLITLHDNDGLPVDVILMLLQYAVSVGKANMKYIGKAGASWAKDGIDDIQKAEKKIKELNIKNLAWRNFESIIGIEHRAPTEIESEAVSRWINDWKFGEGMIKEAYDRCVNMNGKYVLRYMDGIIKRWHSQGIFTIEKALAENQKRRKKIYDKAAGSNASYSIEEYEKFDISDYIY